MRFLIFVFACACGGQIIGNQNGTDASPTNNETFACGDAATCTATTQFCKATNGGTPKTFTQTCASLPSNCHSCDCADTPTQNGETCVCSSDTDKISVTCNLP